MIVSVPDVRTVERLTHTVKTIAEFRAPAGSTWLPLLVDGSQGSVTINDLSVFPGRTCSFRCMGRNDDGTSPLDQGLSTLGGWVRLFHEITRTDLTTFRVPLGYYRIQTLTVDPLALAITVDGSDAGIMLNDYGLAWLWQAELAQGAVIRDFLNSLLLAPTGGIPPWWAHTDVFDRTVLPTTLSTTRVQHKGTRSDAVRDTLKTFGSWVMDMPVDASYVYRARLMPTATSPVDFTLTPGDTGNLEEVQTSVTRAAIYNVAYVNYTPPGSSVPTRIAREYTANAAVAAGGPFGRASVEAVGENITNDAQANARADAVLAGTVSQARTLKVSTTPIYGVEAGDVVNVVGRNGSIAVGRVSGATIPLSVTAGWSLNILAFDPTANIERAVQ